MSRFIRRILAFFLGLGQAQNPRKRPTNWPTREDMLLLPPFEALGLKDIEEVSTGEEAERACRALMAETIIGFDTESKPTFVKGEVSTGPHVAQFSTRDRAYVFVLHDHRVRKLVGALIGSPQVRKVGFGLIDDLRRIRIKLGVEPQGVVELQTVFAEKGHGRGVGAKVGVAIALRRRFSKGGKARTSNWQRRKLNDQQMIYAANDAYASLRVYDALTR